MKTNISRRDFLRKAGISALAAGGLGTVYGCGEDRAEKKPSSDSKVIARTNLHNGDKVGLLGYGAMRWPMTKDEEGKTPLDFAQENGHQEIVKWLKERGNGGSRQ